MDAKKAETQNPASEYPELVVEEPPVLHADSNAVQSPLPRELITIGAALNTDGGDPSALFRFTQLLCGVSAGYLAIFGQHLADA